MTQAHSLHANPHERNGQSAERAHNVLIDSARAPRGVERGQPPTPDIFRSLDHVPGRACRPTYLPCMSCRRLTPGPTYLPHALITIVDLLTLS